MKVRKIPISETRYQYHFICPGCNHEHAFNEKTWTWNRDYNKPTLWPSYLMYGSRFDKNKNSVPFVCHSYIKEGKIEYLDDCTHHLRNQIIELPDYPIINRIIFVGIHNKQELKPLDISTKTGKIITEIIKQIPEYITSKRTNLYNINSFPKSKVFKIFLINKWYSLNRPLETDIIVSLGKHVGHKLNDINNIVKVNHPASNYGEKQTTEYVKKVSELILNMINAKNSDKI